MSKKKDASASDQPVIQGTIPIGGALPTSAPAPQEQTETAASVTPAAAPPTAANAVAVTAETAVVVAPRNGSTGALAHAAEPGTLDVFEEMSAEEQEFIQENSGLEARPEEYRLPLWVYNIQREVVDRITGEKKMCRKDQFINILTDEIRDELVITPLMRVVNNVWQVWNNTEGRNMNYCRSKDEKHGTMIMDHPVMLQLKKGIVRPCVKCPQKEWKEVQDPDTGQKRRMLACSTVHNVIFKDGGTGQPGVVRFQKTAEQAFIHMLRKFFLGQWKVKNRQTGQYTWTDYPFFYATLKISLAMDTSNKSTQFAKPEFSLVKMNGKDEILEAARLKKYLAELQDKAMAEADAQAETVARGEAEEAASFDPSKLEGEGQPQGEKVEGEF